jgi:hypothetical protein
MNIRAGSPRKAGTSGIDVAALGTSVDRVAAVGLIVGRVKERS